MTPPIRVATIPTHAIVNPSSREHPNRRARLLILLPFLVAPMLIAAQAPLQPPSTYPSNVTIIDVTKANLTSETRRIFVFENLPADIQNALKPFLTRATAHPDNTDQDTLLTTLKAAPADARTTDRLEPSSTSKKPQPLTILTIYDLGTTAKEPLVEITEAKRLPRVITDAESVGKALLTDFAGFASTGAPTPATIGILLSTQTPTYDRDDITIKALSRPDGKPADSEGIKNSTCTTANCVLTTITIAYGPEEHLFLSADLPVTKTSQIKYNSTSHQLEAKDTPTIVFAGLNYTFGDIVGTAHQNLFEGITIKAFIAVNKRPSNAFGSGIGYRLPKEKLLGFELDALQPFVAYVFTHDDTTTTAGAPKLKAKYHGNIRGGISFNVDKLTDWLKKKTS